MSRRARKIRQAKKLAERSKMKAAKKARFAAAQEKAMRLREESKGKWRGLSRISNRNRRRTRDIEVIVNGVKRIVQSLPTLTRSRSQVDRELKKRGL